METVGRPTRLEVWEPRTGTWRYRGRGSLAVLRTMRDQGDEWAGRYRIVEESTDKVVEEFEIAGPAR